MRRGVLLARWFRYETARLYQKYGIEESAVDRDALLARELPETFAWQDVSRVWGIKRSGAFKAIGRLIEKGLAADDGQGSYSRCACEAPDTEPGGPVDFGDFES